MDLTVIARGQPVLVGDRPAAFIELNHVGSPVVRYLDEQTTRVVPARKVALSTESGPERHGRGRSQARHVARGRAVRGGPDGGRPRRHRP
jgi:hypothetical protein